MAQNKNISMPQSTAGITRFDEDTGKILLKPAHVVTILILVVVFVLLMHLFGNSILGI
ncbi:MAG: preprotein translocase subunit Sec61beta [Candidatus Woesearchaeota archaeon]|jgi:preprotein translocase subunit Sec61beta